jgi:hypothetical protein
MPQPTVESKLAQEETALGNKGDAASITSTAYLFTCLLSCRCDLVAGDKYADGDR